VFNPGLFVTQGASGIERTARRRIGRTTISVTKTAATSATGRLATGKTLATVKPNSSSTNAISPRKRTYPSSDPRAHPAVAITTASVLNTRRICRALAPRQRRIPTSLVRSMRARVSVPTRPIRAMPTTSRPSASSRVTMELLALAFCAVST
jgi:hypothetical protein